MAIEEPPNVCACCPADITYCCPTLPETVIANATFSNPGDPANTAANVVATKTGGCTYTGGIIDAENSAYLSVALEWVPTDPAVDPHVGVWEASWDDQGYNDQYYEASGSTDWCNPSGAYGPATCDDAFCLDPNDTSTLSITLGTEPSNNDPTITPIANQTNNHLDVVSLQVVANDADGDDLTYTAKGLPYNMGINPTTGLITGTVNVASGVKIVDAVTVTVTDDGYPSKSASTTFGWITLG